MELYIEEQHKLLVVTDLQAVALVTVLDAVNVVKKDGFEQLDPLIIPDAYANFFILVSFTRRNRVSLHWFISGLMWVDSESIDAIVCLLGSSDFPRHHCLGSIERVLKPGGTLLFYPTNKHQKEMDPSLERKMQNNEFLDIQSSSDSPPFWVMGKKPSSENGSSSSIQETQLVLSKVQIDDNMELIDGDDLLSEEDARKRQRSSG